MEATVRQRLNSSIIHTCIDVLRKAYLKHLRFFQLESLQSTCLPNAQRPLAVST